MVLTKIAPLPLSRLSWLDPNTAKTKRSPSSPCDGRAAYMAPGVTFGRRGAQNWVKMIRDRDHPGRFISRHLEVCLFSYVEELFAERGIEVDPTTLFRWVVRFTPLFTEAARFPPAPPRRSLVC